jgi:hypothetical protein
MLGKKLEVKIRPYRASDYDQISEIFFNGTSEVLLASLQMIWNGSEPTTLACHLLLLSLALLMPNGPWLFLMLEAAVVFAVYDFWFLRPK